MIGRREFLAALGGGILVIEEAEAQGRRAGPDSQPKDISGWVHIGETGQITAYAGKAEMGQNVRTSLAQAVAEELRVPATSVRMVVGDTDLTPWDGGTSGSRSTPGTAPILRRAAAAAREMLLDLAAERWKADRAGLKIDGGKVVNAVGQSLAFGDLTRGQKLTRGIEGMPVQPPATESVPKLNGRDIVTGRHQYPSDIMRPGMLWGKVVRPAGFNATLKTVDASQAEAMRGVQVVRDGNFIGVTAPGEDAAWRAAAAVKAEWDVPAQPSNQELFDILRKTGGAGNGGIHRGSIDEGLAAADLKLNQTYTVEYIAHCPLEPRAAVAEWNDGKLTVWTGTQQVFGVRRELASAFGLPETQVRVIVPDPGSGYGGKHSGDAALEAARMAKAAGKPVKVVWTREEEFTWAYFRPAGVIDVSSGVKKNGTITAWDFHNYNSGGAAMQTMYDIPNQRIEFHPSRSPLRQGSYRALAATANHFAREVHMDELAQAVGLDPLEMRLRNLKDPRMRAVLEAAALRFAWRHTKANKNRGFGLAAGFEKGSYVATCVELETDPNGGPPKLLTVVEAFECGGIVNPQHLRNQVEGCIMMALGGAMFEAIRFENGKIRNASFTQYQVPRFHDTPAIEPVLLNRKDIPSAGAGETPIVGLAPAISNAIFDVTGVRRRALPMT